MNEVYKQETKRHRIHKTFIAELYLWILPNRCLLIITQFYESLVAPVQTEQTELKQTVELHNSE